MALAGWSNRRVPGLRVVLCIAGRGRSAKFSATERCFGRLWRRDATVRGTSQPPSFGPASTAGFVPPTTTVHVPGKNALQDGGTWRQPTSTVQPVH